MWWQKTRTQLVMVQMQVIWIEYWNITASTPQWLNVTTKNSRFNSLLTVAVTWTIRRFSRTHIKPHCTKSIARKRTESSNFTDSAPAVECDDEEKGRADWLHTQRNSRGAKRLIVRSSDYGKYNVAGNALWDVHNSWWSRITTASFLERKYFITYGIRAP